MTARPLEFHSRRSWRSILIGPRSYFGIQGRLAWLVVAVTCAVALGTARYLPPDPRGHGTHEALGMPPCSFMLISGIPCPTCGMTTAFSLVMHGRPWAALIAQPAGFVLCIGTFALMVASMRFAAQGHMVTPNWDRIGPVRFTLGFGFLLLTAWGFKIVHGMLASELPIR